MKEKQGNRISFYVLGIFLPLLAGLFLYLTLRPDAYVSLFIGKHLPLPAFPCEQFSGSFVSFLRNYASDMLWAFSLCFAVQAIMGYSQRNLLFTFLLCLSFAVVWEMLQKIGVLYGTFDLLDIVLEALSACLALLIIKKHEEDQNEKTAKNP